MRDPNGVDLDNFPSAMGIVTRLACDRAKQEGVAVEPLLRKAGLNQQQIDDPRSRIAVKAQIQFLALAARTLKDDSLGFHLAQKFDLRGGAASLRVSVLRYDRGGPTASSAIQRGSQ